MGFDYFYGQQADLFSFYRIPKVLFTSEQFWNVSTDAKLLYGILLDRMNLSAKNGWLDEAGRVYIIFTIDEIKESLGCAEQKAIKLLAELEKKCGLVKKKRQGLGKPNLLYVKNFSTGVVDSQFLNCENHSSGIVKIKVAEQGKSQCNNTDNKNIDYSDNNPFPSSEESGTEADGKEEYSEYYQYFFEHLEYEYLYPDYPYDKDMLDNILELIVETMCSKRKMIRIASDDKPVEIVRSRFMKLTHEHIKFVMTCFKENTTKIRNVRQYLLATIYNAPVTIGAYYDALVRHDMANGMIGGGR